MSLIYLKAILAGACLVGCEDSEQPAFPVTTVPYSTHAASEKILTLSPNDRWLVFYKDKRGDYSQYSLAVLDLETNTPHEFSKFPGSVERFDDVDSWTEDSAFCNTRSFIDLRDPQNVRLLALNGKERNNVRPRDAVLSKEHYHSTVELDGEQIPLPGIKSGTCADCYPLRHDKGFLAANLPKEHRQGLEGSRTAIPSRSGEKIYFQKGYDDSKTTLYELNTVTKAERKLTSFGSMSCVRIDKMRLSPNEHYLAFELSRGCNWVGPGRLYVQDLRKGGKTHLVAVGVFGDTQWTSKSDRLFFFYRDPEKGRSPIEVRVAKLPP